MGLLRKVSLAEGVSFLVLLGIAMPLKYMAGDPTAVKIVGWVHGALFVALSALVLRAYGAGRLSFGESAMLWVAALLPFGPFWMDRRLRTKLAD